MKGAPRSPALVSRSKGNGRSNGHRQPTHPNGAITAAQFKHLSERVAQMKGELDHIKRAWETMGTSRQGVREQVEKNVADLGVQFQRIAMMQAEIDRLEARETVLQTEIDQLRTKNPRVGA